MALQYETTKEHTITVTGYEGTIRHLVIPDQEDGCPVTTIGKKAFNKCKKLKTVTIKTKKLKTVGGSAFKGIAKKKGKTLPYDWLEERGLA